MCHELGRASPLLEIKDQRRTVEGCQQAVTQSATAQSPKKQDCIGKLEVGMGQEIKKIYSAVDADEIQALREQG